MINSMIPLLTEPPLEPFPSVDSGTSELNFKKKKVQFKDVYVGFEVKQLSSICKECACDMIQFYRK